MEMEMEFLRKLPTPAELKEEYPVSAQVVATKAERDDETAQSLREKKIN